MSVARTSSRHHDRAPSSSRRRYYAKEDYAQPRDGHTSRSTSHQRYSSPHQRPHRSNSASSLPEGLSHVSRDPKCYSKYGYAPENAVPLLRRQSTQPPRRRTSFISHSNGENEGEGVYHRRAVESTGPRCHSTPHRRHSSSRHATSANGALSTALVVVEDSKQASPRRSARTSTDGSPRRRHHQHRASEVGDSSVVRSPRQHRCRSSASPRRSHRPTGSPIRPERHHSSSYELRHASTKPHARSSQGSPRRHRHSDTTSSTAPAPTIEAKHRQDTLRHSSPRQVGVTAKGEATPHRTHRYSRAKGGSSAVKEDRSPRRHASAHRSRSSRTESQHHSEKRHRHHRTSTPDSVGEASHRSRHTPFFRPSSEDLYAVPPPPTGSTYLRPTANSHTAGHPRSGSHIEVISVNSTRLESTNGWSHPHPNAPHPSRRSHEDDPPVVIPSPRGQQIMQRIDSTRHWIQKMKEELKDREHEFQRVDVARKRAARHSARREPSNSASHAESARRHRTSSTGSRRHTRGETHAAVPPPVGAASQAISRQHTHEAIPPVASSNGSRRVSEQQAPPKHEKRHHNSRSSVKAPPPPPATAPRTPTSDPDPQKALMDTVSSSREGGFDYPIFSFMSFLDGNTFDSTASLCQYNVNLAESLSDEHLDILRAAVFNHNEEAFAELLYGDDVEAEIGGAAASLGHSENSVVPHELAVLQQAAVRRFNDKCTKALKRLLSAEGGLAKAVQVAASQLEHQAHQVDEFLMVAP
ncbi:hypothetical protein, conserved [Leishmania lindenbergi]|uniref:Uncharacterized protein n=1 Tax=Leishmania lindenbergi TaxID=651832 RepID=A0AAW2ZUI0_9TRYP